MSIKKKKWSDYGTNKHFSKISKSIPELLIEAGKEVTIRIMTPSEEIEYHYEGPRKLVDHISDGICPHCKAGLKIISKNMCLVIDRGDGQVKAFQVKEKVGKQIFEACGEEQVSLRDLKISFIGKASNTVYQIQIGPIKELALEDREQLEKLQKDFDWMQYLNIAPTKPEAKKEMTFDEFLYSDSTPEVKRKEVNPVVSNDGWGPETDPWA